MKKIFFSLVTLFLCVASLPAQRFFDVISPTADTLVNQDTVIYTTELSGGPLNLDVPYEYSIHVMADSVSGANAGFAYLQFSNHRSGSKWYTAQTLTIDGSGTDEAFYEGTCRARRVRVYFITPSGTRRVKPHVYASFKRSF